MCCIKWIILIRIFVPFPLSLALPACVCVCVMLSIMCMLKRSPFLLVHVFEILYFVFAHMSEPVYMNLR